MGAVGMVAGSQIRRRWHRIMVVTVLVGVVGAVVFATAAGARRSASALDRFIASSRASDLTLTGIARKPLREAQIDELRQVPGVLGVGVGRGVLLSFDRAPDLSQVAAVDSTLGGEVDRPRIVAGRAANRRAVDEITIGETLAAQLHVGVGDHLDASSYTPAQVAGFFTGQGDFNVREGPRVRLKIVGIDRRPLDLGDKGAAGGVLILTPAFNRAYATSIGDLGTLLRVRTRDPAVDVPRVIAAAHRIFGPSPDFDAQSVAIETQGANNAIAVITVALWVFAAVAALAGVVAIGIVLTREISSARGEQSAFRALGLTRGQRVATIAPQAFVIAGGGALLAVVGGIAASPLFPIGVARRADPDPGVHVDGIVLGVIIVAVGMLVFGIAMLAALRVTRPVARVEAAGERRRPPKVVEAAARVGLPPTATTGLRMALEPGSNDTAVPIRSAYLGAVFGVLGVVAVLVFASSLDHLVATPRFSGYDWDFSVVDNSSTACNRSSHGITREAAVTALAGVCVQDIQLDGRPLSALAFADIRGAIDPVIVKGRAPTKAHEVALGATTLRALGKSIGDTVQAPLLASSSGSPPTASYQIVGQVALPALGSTQPLADGAVFTNAGLAKLVDPTNASRYLVGRFAPGTDRAAVERRIADLPKLGTPTAPAVAVEIARLRQINWFPGVLAALLGGLALLAVGHALVTAVRRRRRDLALLKTLGFDRRQVRATVAWQASILAAVGLVVGIPVGLLVGGLVWRHVTDGLGIADPAAVPVVAIALTIPGVLVLVNLIAFLPARNAAQTRPAVALRAE